MTAQRREDRSAAKDQAMSGGTLSSGRRSPIQSSVSLVTEPRAGASQAVPRQIAPLAVVVRAASRPPNTGRHDGPTLPDASARRSPDIVTAPFRRGENVATQSRPIPPRPPIETTVRITLPREYAKTQGYIPPVWENGPPTLIAIVSLIGACIAVAFLGYLVMQLA